MISPVKKFTIRVKINKNKSNVSLGTEPMNNIQFQPFEDVKPEKKSENKTKKKRNRIYQR